MYIERIPELLMNHQNDILIRQWAILDSVPVFPNRITATQILSRLKAQGFSISKRTLERDLQSLAALFGLLADDRSRPYGWSWPRNTRTFTLPAMSPVQALTLALARDHLGPLLPSSLMDTLTPYFEIAENVLLRSESTQNTAQWRNKIAIIPASQALIPPKYNEEIVETVHAALLSEMQLEIEYAARRERKRTYPIHPLGLVQRGPVIYLVATLFEYEDIRTLALHRVSSAKKLDTPARIPPDFNLRQFIGQGAFDIIEDGQLMKLEVRFAPEAAQHLLETPLSKDQEFIQEDESVLIKATVANTQQLRWWLRAFGEQIEVIQPRDLRREFSRTAKAMRRRYRKKGK